VKALVVTKGGQFLGGASRIAVELVAGLNQKGFAARLACYTDTPDAATSLRIRARGLVPRVMRHLDWRLETLGVTRRLAWEMSAITEAMRSGYDVVHFHDVYECTSPLLLRRLASRQAVFLTVHDCSPFTGGCLYPGECRRFEATCGTCPQRQRIGRFDFTSGNIELRRRVADCVNLHFVFPSTWIQSEAHKSLKMSGRSHVVPNGFDPRPYDFTTKLEARVRLGLEPHGKVVLIGSHSLSNPYKGASLGFEALRSVAHLDPVVVVLGNPDLKLQMALGQLRVISAGFVSEKRRLADYYAAADLLLFPSLADNLPIMIQESMAAGTPVLAFDTGGISELIDDGLTGWLAQRGDVGALAAKLRAILEAGVAPEIGIAAREVVATRFSMDDFVERHLSLYRAAAGVS
jgi:glycosyltransferase involved in cell wall biosynthesis